MPPGHTYRDAKHSADPLATILAALARSVGARQGKAFVREARGDALRLAVNLERGAEERGNGTRAFADDTARPPTIAQLEAGTPVYLGGDSPPHGAVPDSAPCPEPAPCLAVPLIGSDGRCIGALTLEMDPPQVEQLELAATMGRVAAIVIEQANLASSYAEEGRRSQALLDMFQQITHSQALPQVLSGICRKTVEAFGVSCATVFDGTQAVGDLVQIANHGKAPDISERFVRYRYNPGKVPREEHFLVGRTVVIQNADATADERAWLHSLKLHTAALLPLGSADAVTGALAVGIEEQREFTPTQLLGLEMVAHHATTAMVWARFLRNAETAVRFRAAVSALAVELNAQTERAQTLRLLCARGRAIFRSAWTALLLASGDRLIEVAADGDIEGATEALSVSLTNERNAAVRAFAGGEVVFETALRGTHGKAPPAFQSVLAIPLVGTEGPGGVLLFRDLQDAHTIGPGMVGEARILGALAGAVLRNLDLLTRLHTANADLRRANILKDQLLANASHDLRTPLSVIIGYGHLAIEGTFGDPPPELRHVIERMVASACEQLTLVEDLLNLSRMELNILSLKSACVPVAPLLAEMDFMASSLVKDRPVRAVVHPVDGQLTVQADRDRLRQILINLLSNAAKFTDEGLIELRAVSDGVRVQLAVRDTGIGIAPEHQTTIFEPFAQADEERASAGAGLGLAIARRLAHIMNGTLTVESEPGRGSTFFLSLPVGRSESAGDRDEPGDGLEPARQVLS